MPKPQTVHVGQRYGLMTVTRDLGTRRVGKLKRRFVLVDCECGTTGKEMAAGSIASLDSCGCEGRKRTMAAVRKAKTKHGMWRSGTWSSWSGMIARCQNPGVDNWESYGGRGIRVHLRWLLSFEAFLADMGERPAGMSIDRIDVDGHYEPRNCRWATTTEQNRNRRFNVMDESRAERARSMRADGKSYGAIATAIGVSRWVVRDVIKGRTWRT